MRATIHKNTGGFTGIPSYYLELIIGLGDNEEKAKERAKEILQDALMEKINIDEIPIKEHFSL